MARRHKKGAKDDSKSKDPREKFNQEGSEHGKGAPTKEQAVREVEERAGKENDPEWYNVIPGLLRDCASLPFGYSLGDNLQPTNDGQQIYDSTGTASSIGTTQWKAAAGICTLFTKPSLGFSAGRTDPANVAASAFYTHVRYVNSGRKNYDPCDLMLYALTIADIYSFVFWCRRIYNKAFMYSQLNKYIGAALLKSEHVDHDDVIKNLANFRYWLNTFINKVSSWAVPANISLFKRKAFMYAGLYTESPCANIKDQMYQFAPAGFFKFQIDGDTASNTKAGMLDYVPVPWTVANPATVNDIINYGESLLQNIYGDEDFGLMSGDILKAYGDQIIMLGDVESDGGIVPIYDLMILSQFKNATVHNAIDVSLRYRFATAGGNHDVKYGSVYQNPETGYLQYREAATSPISDYAVNFQMNKIISVDSPVPQPEEVMEASRLTTGMRKVTTAVGGTTLTELYCGSEVVVAAEYTDCESHTFVQRQFSSNTFSSPTMPLYLPVMNQFHYGPIAWEVSSGPGAIAYLHLFSSVENYTWATHEIIARLHEAALLSMMYVPGVAKFISSGL